MPDIPGGRSRGALGRQGMAAIALATVGLSAASLLAAPASATPVTESGAAPDRIAAGAALQAGPRSKQSNRQRIRLGMHNYQAPDASRFLSKPGSPGLVSRHNCHPTMQTPGIGVRIVRRSMDGPRGLFVGCGTREGQWKYESGPMSGAYKWPGSPEVAGRGSAATPSIRSYTQWIKMLRDTLGHRLWRFQVWNEANLGMFYRGSPRDLVDLTFAAERVLGRKRVIAPSFVGFSDNDEPSGGWFHGQQLSRLAFMKTYWKTLAKRTRRLDVPLPVSAATFNGYGRGETLAEAEADRLRDLRKFRSILTSILGRRMLPLWDTEWNLRRTDSLGLAQPGLGFPDTRASSRAWIRSSQAAACLGYRWQFTFVWTDAPATKGFESSQIQMNPETSILNRAFRQVNRSRYTCPS